MKDIDHRLLGCLIEQRLAPQVLRGNFGLEKENVRVDAQGRLALTPHPAEFGDKLLNPYIKTDFSESQIEVVTPVCSSIEEAYSFLENLQDIVSQTLKGEYLWPQSNPPVLPREEDIPIAVYETGGTEERRYREKLAAKYGRRKQLLSGIHYNFSFSETLLETLYRELGQTGSYRDFKDSIYLKLTRNFLRYRWLIIYLTGASPAFHRTFNEEYIKISEKLDDDEYYFKNLSSLRNSKCGYKNDEDFMINYQSVEEYVNSIQSLIDAGKIDSASEFYNPIRLKGRGSKAALDQLNNEGISYIELRILDLNPFSKNGILLEDLYFIHLFMVYMLLKDEPVSKGEQQSIPEMFDDLSTVMTGPEGVSVYDRSGELVSLREEALGLTDGLQQLVKTLNVQVGYLTSVIEAARAKILNPELTYANRLIAYIRQKSYIGFHMDQARDYLRKSSTKINLTGYEDMELSTQILIRDAIRRGIAFQILDRAENFLRLSRGNRVEYVKQATKTSRDSYSTVLIMENKVITKQVLGEHGLRVPAGECFSNLEDALKSYHQFKENQIVIKPKSTNFGLGISIFRDIFTKEQFHRALEIAFRYDKTVLVEEFISGKEFRFLVIDGEVAGVLHRVPANVMGDGVKTIRELVREKNKDPLRGEGHKTPLEKIVLGEVEEMFLTSQGKSFDYIPCRDEIVFLRENSNISTGGDSIDYTDRVHESYKAVAVKAARVVGAAITGVDMIISDQSNYAIIELNFNPAIYMHCYPYQGRNRRVGEKILSLLFD